MLTRIQAIAIGVTQFDWAWNNYSRFSLRSSSEPSEEEEDASEPDSLLDMNGAFAVGFTGTVRVTGGPHPSRLPKDCNLKPLDYGGLAPAD
jgi:hypothetical protein